jgi:hypothetical protein
VRPVPTQGDAHVARVERERFGGAIPGRRVQGDHGWPPLQALQRIDGADQHIGHVGQQRPHRPKRTGASTPVKCLAESSSLPEGLKADDEVLQRLRDLLGTLLLGPMTTALALRVVCTVVTDRSTTRRLDCRSVEGTPIAPGCADCFTES